MRFHGQRLISAVSKFLRINEMHMLAQVNLGVPDNKI